MAEEYRTIMYSVGVKGEVITHRFPWNADEKIGMQKLQGFLRRGFTFDDPRKDKGLGMPEVIITRVVDSSKPILEEETLSSTEETIVLDVPAIRIVPLVSVETDIPEVREAKEEPEFLIPCPECGRGFKSALGVEAHMRKHRREKGEIKPYMKTKVKKGKR